MASLDTWLEVAQFFDRDEFEHPDKLSDELIHRIYEARRIAGIPFHIKSDYREGDDKAHGRGTGLDFGLAVEPRRISGAERMVIYDAMRKAGFTRIGLYDKHIHGDVDKELPPDVLWVGVSA